MDIENWVLYAMQLCKHHSKCMPCSVGIIHFLLQFSLGSYL
jgi:hypothetical protein